MKKSRSFGARIEYIFVIGPYANNSYVAAAAPAAHRQSYHAGGRETDVSGKQCVSCFSLILVHFKIEMILAIATNVHPRKNAYLTNDDLPVDR